MTNEIMGFFIPFIGGIGIGICLIGIGIILKEAKPTFGEKVLAVILGLVGIVIIECIRVLH